MLSVFNEVRVLRREGRIHRKLIIRISLLSIVSIILAGIVFFNVAFKGVGIMMSVMLAVVGFVLGRYIFFKMNVVSWNEKEEVVGTGRMNAVSYVVLALYVAFEIGLRTLLGEFFPTNAMIFLLSGVSGMLLGRVVGTIIEIHGVYKHIYHN